MFFTWLCTVRALIPRRSAISVTPSPEQLEARNAEPDEEQHDDERQPAEQIGVPGRERPQDLGLPRREAPQQQEVRTSPGARAELRQDRREVGVGHDELASGRSAHDVHELVHGPGLRHEPAGAGRHRGRDDARVLEPGDHDDLGVGVDRAEASGGLHPIHPGQVDVHEHDVGRGLLADAEGFVEVVGGAEQAQARLALEGERQGLAEELVIVHHEHADRIRGPHGLP